MPEPDTGAAARDDATRETLARLRIDRAPAGRRARRRWRGLVVLVVLLLAVALAWGPLTRRFLLPSVTVEQVIRSPATQGAVRTTASGYVVARRRAAISSRLQGRLERLFVDVGDRVEKDQLLGELGHDDLDASVAEARAAVVARQRDISVLEQQRRAVDARVRSLRELLLQVRAAVPPAEERLRAAAPVVGVKRRLAGTGAGTPDDLAAAMGARDIAEMELASTRSAVGPAEAAVAEARADLDVLTARVAAAESEVVRAQAVLARAEAFRADADILAPFAGVVLRKEAEVGEMVAPVNAAGSTTRGAIVTLADFASLEMEVDVIERDVGTVEEGLPCRITLDAREAPYAGHVRQVVPTADRTRGSVLVKVTFDELDGTVLPEMSGRVEFLDPDAADRVLTADRVLVPARAIVRTAERTYVWTTVNEVLHAVDLTTADEPPDDRDRVRVLDGLRGGELVVVDPRPAFTEGQSVRPHGEAR